MVYACGSCPIAANHRAPGRNTTFNTRVGSWHSFSVGREVVYLANLLQSQPVNSIYSAFNMFMSKYDVTQITVLAMTSLLLADIRVFLRVRHHYLKPIHTERINFTWNSKMKPKQAYLSQRFKLVDEERRFRRACQQIILLNQKLGDLQKRYRSAKKENLRTFRYSLRLRLAVVEGLRNMYYDYAHEKADQVAVLRKEMFGQEVQIISWTIAQFILFWK